MAAPGHSLPLRRTVIAAGLIALAIPLTQSRDLLAEVSRPLVVGVLKVLGVDAADGGEVIRAGHLEVPWSRDCDGVNLVFLLLALAVWVTRHEAIGWRYWLRLGAMIPAAIAANLLRVLTLIAYRAIAYPAVESPQGHYFIGFVWLIPFLAAITPLGRRPLVFSLMETTHAAAVVALLAPLSGSPNGTLVSLAAILALSLCRAQENPGAREILFSLAWITAGLGIAVLNIESFWLPWLLACPLLLDGQRRHLIPWLVCLACTHPLIAMQPWSWVLAAVGLGLAWWSRGIHVEAGDGSPSRVWKVGHSLARPVFFASLALPFLASSLLPAPSRIAWTPPEGLRSRALNQEGYEVQLPGQPGSIGLACYPARSRDRHHTVKVCLKYRGVELVPSEEDKTVLTEGQHWYREFFLQEDELLDGYSAYLKKTFRPRADPGVHLIFVAPRDELRAGEFADICTGLAEQLHRLTIPSRFAHESGARPR
jgi:exosortase/archaeosortase family protein